MSQTSQVVTQAPQPQPKPIPVVKLNGAKPAVPTVETPAPQPNAELEGIKAEHAKLKAGMDELQKQARRHAMERQKFSQEKGAYLKDLEEAKRYKAERERFKLNPEQFLKGELGDDYYDKLTNMRLSGGALPAPVLEAELKALNEKWEARFGEEFQKRDEAAKTSQQQEAQRRLEGTRRQLQAEAGEYVKANFANHGALQALGDEAGLARMLAQRIEAEYGKSERRDESGELLVPGKVLSAKEAADLVEGEILALVEKVTATEAWKSLSKSSSSGEQVQQRRTLNNSVTGRTPGREPPMSDEERRERAIQAFNRVAARNVP